MSETIEIARSEFERLQRRLVRFEQDREKLLGLLVDFGTFIAEGRPEQFDAANDMYEEGDEYAPFMTESFLYVLLGKEDARSVLSHFRRLCEAVGRNSDGEQFEELLRMAYVERWRGSFELEFETTKQRKQFLTLAEFRIKNRWRFRDITHLRRAEKDECHSILFTNVTAEERQKLHQTAGILDVKVRLTNAWFTQRDA